MVQQFEYTATTNVTSLLESASIHSTIDFIVYEVFAEGGRDENKQTTRESLVIPATTETSLPYSSIIITASMTSLAALVIGLTIALVTVCFCVYYKKQNR